MKFRIQKQKRAAGRLDAVLFVIALLWFMASLLLLALYRPNANNAVQPHSPAQDFVAYSIASPRPPVLL